MLKIKQYFCNHNFYLLAQHRIVSEDLHQCIKCGVYMVRHRGIGVDYKCKEFPLCGNWDFVD